MLSLEEYKKTCARPGKYEREEPWVPYFDEWSMDGIRIDDNEDSDHYALAFEIDHAESEAFGLKLGSWIVLFGDSVGFVYGFLVPEHLGTESAVREWWGKSKL